MSSTPRKESALTRTFLKNKLYCNKKEKEKRAKNRIEKAKQELKDQRKDRRKVHIQNMKEFKEKFNEVKDKINQFKHNAETQHVTKEQLVTGNAENVEAEIVFY